MRSLCFHTFLVAVLLGANAAAGENKGVSVGVGMTSRGPAPVITETSPVDGSTIFSSTPTFRIVFNTDMDTSRTDITKVVMPVGINVVILQWSDARTLDIRYNGYLPTYGAKRVDLLDGYFMTPTKLFIAYGSGFAFNYADTNRPPYIVDGPNMTFVNSVAKFTVKGFDPDHDPLDYAWDFGDGSTGTGEAPEHRYGGNGPFLVNLVVSDGRGGTATAAIVVSAMAKAPWIVTKATVGLNFAKAGADKIMVQGTVEMPAGWDPSKKTMIVNVNGAAQTFTLSAKGTAKVGKDTFKLTRKLKNKQFLGGAVKIAFTLNGNFQAAMGSAGLGNETTPKTGKTVSLVLGLVLDIQPYESVVDFVYKAKAGKSGKATKKTAVH